MRVVEHARAGARRLVPGEDRGRRVRHPRRPPGEEGRRQPQSRRPSTTVDLAPRHDVAFFRDVAIPADLPVFTIKDRALVGSTLPEPIGGDRGRAEMAEVAARVAAQARRYDNIEVKARRTYTSRLVEPMESDLHRHPVPGGALDPPGRPGLLHRARRDDLTRRLANDAAPGPCVRRPVDAILLESRPPGPREHRRDDAPGPREERPRPAREHLRPSAALTDAPRLHDLHAPDRPARPAAGRSARAPPHPLPLLRHLGGRRPPLHHDPGELHGPGDTTRTPRSSWTSRPIATTSRSA